MENDPRFEDKLKQPKFRRIPNHERKVKIDKRFKSMFKDDKFQVKYTVDKRGRPVNQTAKEDLRRYYDLGSDESSSQSADEEEDGTAATIDDDNFAKQDAKISEKVKRKLKNLKVDYARGEGVLLSDSSSDDDDESEEDEEEDDGSIDHAWGELDQDAEHTTEITCRLAVCNMNWDRVRAVDLMVLLSCFLPGSGVIQSVTIYPSEFGIERMQEEELKGPMELVESEAKNDDDDHDGSKYHMEKLRQYELNRLKYYYAVIVFDSCGSANKVYEECDGVEYEATSTKFDLRFIPDDVTFDQEPKDVCMKLPDPSEYRPKYFTTCALQQTKVNLTWDETDPHRTEITKRLNSKKDVDYNDVQAYLASTSEEEESEEEVSEEEENLKGLSSINRYKSLLLGLEDGESSTKNDGGLEITWGVDQKEKAEKMVKEKLNEKEKKTPFQMFLEKRKEKKKLKREAAKRRSEEGKDDNSDDIPSDVDLDDPYFADELKSKKKNKKKSKKNRKEESEEDEGTEKQKAELALLLANNDDDGRKHFSLKEIQKRESEEDPKKNRKKRKVVEEKETVQDDFKIDVADERFSALYNNHLFSIDPNDPNYKKTKGIAAIESEKVRRREKVQEKEVEVEKPAIRPETQILIKRMKRKAEAFDSKNKRKKIKKS